MISIIIPVYNAENFLCSTVDSILSQNSLDYELLLVDDGSQDQSGKICDEYARQDSRVRVFHKQNGGVSSARNMGIENSNGEWLMFVDSDDKVLLSALNTINDCLNIPEGQYQDLILFRHQRNGVSIDVPLGKTVSVSQYLKKILSYKIEPAPWAKLYRSSRIGSLRFNEDLKIGEDLLFNFEYVAKIKDNCRIMYCDKDVYSYNLRQDSAMHMCNIGNEYKKLNNIAIPIMKSYIGENFCNEISMFEAINLFASFRNEGKLPSSEEQIRMQQLSRRINNLQPDDIITRYLYIVSFSLAFGRLFLLYRFVRVKLKARLRKMYISL